MKSDFHEMFRITSNWSIKMIFYAKDYTEPIHMIRSVSLEITILVPEMLKYRSLGMTILVPGDANTGP